MADNPMQDYQRLSEDGDDSDSSNESTEQPPSFHEINMQKHGYTIKKEIGRGATGIVFLVEKEEDQFVVKQLNFRDTKELIRVQKEIKILKEMVHGYIVKYVDSFEDQESGLVYIVMEYCAGGDLSEKMKTQENGFFEEQQILDWFVQICLALQYIHKKNVLHRDIKPENVFLTEDGCINLGDFGFSKMLESPSSDIWSLGWLLHDLCMLNVWSDKKEKRNRAHVLSMDGTLPHISNEYSEDVKELIRQMLSCDPKDRPSADEILAKPFLEAAVKKRKDLPETLKQRLNESINDFNEAYNNHYKEFKTLVDEWGETADLLEKVHYKATSASLSGAVIGAAGGITALTGAILVPFTLGASFIVSVVGIGISVAGGVTGLAANIADEKKRKKLCKVIEQLKPRIYNGQKLIHCLLKLRKLKEKIDKFQDFASNNVLLSWKIGKSTLGSVRGLDMLGNCVWESIATRSATAVGQVTVTTVGKATAAGQATATATATAATAGQAAATATTATAATAGQAAATATAATAGQAAATAAAAAGRATATATATATTAGQATATATATATTAGQATATATATAAAAAGRATAVAAASGVLSGLSVIIDAIYIAKNSLEINQMRKQWKTDDPEKVTSSVLKATAEIRKTHNDLLSVLKDIKKTHTDLNKKREKKKCSGVTKTTYK